MSFLTATIERSMLFPGSATQGLPEATVHLRPEDLLEFVPTCEDETVAVAVRVPKGPVRTGVVYCYGNGMTLAGAVSDMDWFSANGQRAVAIPEYQGYGLSSGQPSEAGCVAAGLAAIELLKNKFHLSSERLILAGWSIGAAVALELAATVAPAGLVLLSPFTSVRDMAAAIAPPFLRPFARGFAKLAATRFDNLNRICAVRCPVLIAHGRMDNLVPFEMSEALAANVPEGRRQLISIPLAGHNDLFERGGIPLRTAYETFCTRCLNPRH